MLSQGPKRALLCLIALGVPMGTGLKMLTAEHCLRRAERLKIKMLTTDEPEKGRD